MRFPEPKASHLLVGTAVVVGSLAMIAARAHDPAAPAPFSYLSAERGMTSSAYLALLPDGETKRRFILDCTGCHQFDALHAMAGGANRSRESWFDAIDRMLSFAGASSGFPIISASRDPGATAEWLSRNLAGASPTAVAPTTVPEGFEVTEFDLPKPQDLPHDVAITSDGRVAITGQLSGVLYTLDPASGEFTEMTAPFGNPRAIEVDAGGDWWVVFGSPLKIGRMRAGTGEWETWDTGTYPHEAALDAESRAWFNGHFSKQPEVLGYVDPATGERRTFEVPAPPMGDGGSTIPYGLRAAPDGTIWMTQLIGGRLVKFDPAAETFDLYPFPTPFSGPRRLDIAADGTVWIPEYANNRLARFDPETETFTEYELPTPDALPYVARIDHRTGAVWVGTAAADLMARFDPESETFVEIPLPTNGALVRHIAIDPRNGDVWGGYGPFPPLGPKVFRVHFTQP